METELTVVHAETYDIPLTQKLYGKKLDLYVSEALGRMHPGFCEESLWDYEMVYEGGKKVIKACVCDKDFYMESRLENGGAKFYIKTSEGRKVRLFQPYKFSPDGRRRKGRVFLIPALLLAVLCVLSVSFIFLKEDGKVPLEVPSEPALEKPVVPDIFCILNEASGVVYALGGKAESVNFTGSGGGEIVMSVRSCSARELSSGLEKIDGITGTVCGEVDYTGESESFDIHMYITLPPFVQRQAEESGLLDLMERMTTVVKENGGVPVSALCDSQGGRIFFQMNVKTDVLSKVNEALAAVLRKEKLFPLSFSENCTGESDFAFISLDAVLMEEGYEDTGKNEDEKLSLIFPRKKTPVRENRKAELLPSVSSSEKAEAGRYLKIGTVRKDGKLYGYYRTEEGKIVILGEKDE